MIQLVLNPKSKNELSSMNDANLIKYCYKNGLLRDPMLLNLSRNKFIIQIYKSQFNLRKLMFEEIIHNSDYFEQDGKVRYYFVCTNCGYVTKSCIDHESKYLDLHCKCGDSIFYDEYTIEEIENIYRDIQESKQYGEYFMKDFYNIEEKESIDFNIRRFKKLWYYGY